MKKYAVIGEKLSHSLSPDIHEFIFNQLGMDASYVIREFPREETANIIQTLKDENYEGVNVTIPYKQNVMPFLDVISPEALAIGAVNTVVFKNGKTYGYNTDYYGFGKSLEHERVSLSGKKTVLLGAGGAAKALIAYCHDAKASELLVVARSMDKLLTLKEQFPYIETAVFDDTEKIYGDVIINATPVGMYPKSIERSPVSEDIIKRFHAAVDIIYNPLKTRFIQMASDNGLTVVTGLYMLIYQAIKAEEIFQETPMDYNMCEAIYPQLADRFQ